MGQRAHVFGDDRVDMFPRAIVDDEVELIRGGPSWQQILDRWDADVVLWQRGAPLDLLLGGSAQWQLAYADQGWVVYLRR